MAASNISNYKTREKFVFTAQKDSNAETASEMKMTNFQNTKNQF